MQETFIVLFGMKYIQNLFRIVNYYLIANVQGNTFSYQLKIYSCFWTKS